MHALRLFFKTSPLVQHHLDSYNAMIETGIPTFIRASNPHELELQDGRYIRVFIGGKEGKVRYVPPTNEDGTAIVPHACRLDNTTYELTVLADIEVEYVMPSVKTVTFKDIEIGRIPLMLRSKYCYLTGLDGYDYGECKYELGGYFIIDGAEKVLLTQEALGNNMFYAGSQKRKESLDEAAVKSFKNDREYYASVRSISEDGSRGPYSHFIVIPSPVSINEKEVLSLGQDRRVATVTLPGFRNELPLISVFRALGLSSDKAIYESALLGVPESNRSVYSDLFTQLIMGHERLLQTSELTDMDFLVRETRTKSKSEVVRCIHELMFPHLDDDFRVKGYHLARLFKMAMDQALELEPPSDRDSFSYKRLETSGDLFFTEFRRIFRETSKSMLLDLDKKVSQFERKAFEGTNLANVFQAETVNRFWKKYQLMSEFLKSFKGAWGGEDGIAQELSRMSYAGTISHLRRTNLNMDRTSNKKEPRRFHASQMGLLCPVDSPDGRNIGYVKSLALFARISTATPSSIVRDLVLKQKCIRLSDLSPTLWSPIWTPVFINSDLVCASLETEDLHRVLLTARRSGVIDASVSLGWNRVSNTYTITCDSGRPIRPVYREGTTDEMIRSATSWEELLKHIDYIDALETDTLRLSFSLSPVLRSELHTSFSLSALTCLIPFADHNPGTRNAFAIAQTKQTCAWYHTNYRKRFDTIAVMLCNPQKPLTQTWMYSEMMGRGGCMPYGENVVVAITTYGGYNQEDSVMLNGTSMRRGMFQSLYMHSYDISEEMLDPALQTHTEVSNVTTDPEIKRKDADYSKLDGEGVIKVGSMVAEDTVLLGIRTPQFNADGTVKSYVDSSQLPKKGQRGRVDGVHPYATRDGLKGFKIRIVEERYPVLGDKLGSRHSQKGTCGLILEEEDMPFTSKGVRPDLIFNPHALPTRMTIGQWIESASGKLATHYGAVVDGTPFTTKNRVQVMHTLLRAEGFEPYGSEILYNGMTGEMMEAEIFMGPTYYQRMKHMVEDKINSRSTGPKKLLTRQPVEGRGDGGGLRIGEMERDVLVAHGISKFAHESLMDRSDGVEMLFDKEQGILDTSRDKIAMPYAMTLFIHELESMGVSVKVETA